MPLPTINRLAYKSIDRNQPPEQGATGAGKLEDGFALVVDVGKTLSKVTLWSREGRCLARETRPNQQHAAAPYAPLDTAATADWLVQTLARFADHPVEAIIPVAHGAAVAGLRGGVLAFTPPDYEWDIPADMLAAYREERDPFADTGSPALPLGLNLGAQLHYLEALAPDQFAETTLLPYAQYWAWLLSGVAVSEVSSLGCHTDLWSPTAHDFSPMAWRRGWAAQFAPLARAGDAIGTLRPELASLTGLSSEVRILAGLHDSNAALLAARGFAEIAGREATVLSTGTWFVAMRSPAAPVDLAALPEARDCLVNVDVAGQPVPSARYMGGREIELLGPRIDRAGTEGIAEVFERGVMILPAVVPDCGPFPDARGHWIGAPESEDEHIAAAALYAALMADASLDLIGSQGLLLIEGRFAASELFTRALAALRPDSSVLAIAGDADVSFGALRLLAPDLAPHAKLAPIVPLAADLAAYRARWRAHVMELEQKT
jgi:sugar (pentulose or hexulose) kinase